MTSLQECIAQLSCGDEADRIYAAEDIGYANQADGVGPLLAALGAETSRAVREAIFGALLQIENDAVIEGMIGFLDSEDSFLRNEAVDLLRARLVQALPYLERAFRGGSHDRRKFVVDVIARLGSPEAASLYQAALNDSDLNVVITAVESIGNARQDQFRKHIEALISPATHPMLLAACLEALTQIGDSASVEETRRRLGPCRQLPPYLQPSYLKLLGAVGAPASLEEIAELATDDSLLPAVVNALASMRNRHPDLFLPGSLAAPLRRAVSHGGVAVAYQAVRLMGALIGEEAVLAFVAECLGSSEKVIRIGAIQAMRESRAPIAQDLLRERLARETDEEVLQAASR
jgi:HEAT repeat protein